jgi:CheY-like chemotaxis protein
MQEEDLNPPEIGRSRPAASGKPFDGPDPDAAKALVCEADVTARDTLTRVLTSMGYQTTQAESAREAIESMRLYLFDLVVLDERFDCSDRGTNDVLAYLQTLNMAIRRQMFVAILSDSRATLDNMAAFNMSVNVIINAAHLDKTGTILKGALADDARFYRIMKDTLKRLGKR